MAYGDAMNIKIGQIGILAYALLYFVLACAMEGENITQGYPMIYVGLSMVAQTLVVCGVVLFALERSPDFAKLWRWLFPLLLVELAVGIVFDATIPSSSEGSSWLANEVFGLWLAAPAYYFNFKVAHYSG
jgi:hypothetical protein